MARYLMLALNGPVEGDGKESAYNDWYNRIHIPDLRAVPGIKSARRFKVMQSNLQWPYVAAYEIETDDLAKTMDAMQAGLSPFDESFDRSNSAHVLALEIDC